MRVFCLVLMCVLASTAALVPSMSSAAPAGAGELMPFKRDLMAALTLGLEGGTVAAVDACQLVAPGLPATHAERGFEVGRTSDRLRNPDNAPPDWVAPVLAGMVAGEIEVSPQQVSLADGRLGYLEPIRVGGMCLQCHGNDLAPGVAAALDARYPSDQARGYAVGDLRGLFWLVPAAE